MIKTAFGAVFIAGLATAYIGPAHSSDDYPRHPIRIINASSAGGASDIFVRAVSDELQKSLKQPLVVENRPGGAFNIAIRACADSAPDGYTFCVLPGEAIMFNSYLFKNLPFDPETSIEPVMNLFFIPQVLAVRADLGVRTVDDLAAASKAKPRTLSYASPGITQGAFVESFINKQKGGDLVKVPFRGGGEAVNAMLTGATPVAFVGVANLKGLLDAQSVVGLVVDTKERFPSLPQVPTLKEIGFTGDMVQPFFALFAPAKTPEKLSSLMRAEITRILADEAFVKRNITDRSLLTADYSLEELRKLIAEGKAAAGRIVKESGLLPQ